MEGLRASKLRRKLLSRLNLLDRQKPHDRTSASKGAQSSRRLLIGGITSLGLGVFLGLAGAGAALAEDSSYPRLSSCTSPTNMSESAPFSLGTSGALTLYGHRLATTTTIQGKYLAVMLNVKEMQNNADTPKGDAEISESKEFQTKLVFTQNEAAPSDEGNPGNPSAPSKQAINSANDTPAGSGNTTPSGESSGSSSTHETPSEPSSNQPSPHNPASNETGESESGSTDPSTQEAPLSPCSLVVAGTTIPYQDVRGGTTPSEGGGLWLGSDNVNDGSWGYFVGHNPGSFTPVKSLKVGSPVTVCDSSGKSRTYTVCDIFSVDATATWKTIAPRVVGYGESIALQTCNDDGTTLTIVVAS